jgi:lipid-binding SYLF domain-containing protein
VKQAQRAGVSTEGSTIEILERINHASVVKQAQKAGVSTEGSTIEILERINRKALEEYLK